MFKPLIIATTTVGSLVSLAGCPPPEQPAERCEVTVALAREPRREALTGIDKTCAVNVYLDPRIIEGQYPWRRCVSYWEGEFVDDGVTWICKDVRV